MSTSNHECAPVSPLVATLVQSMFRQSRDTTNTLIDSLMYQEAHLRAELDLMREATDDLLSGPFMPMPHTLTQALYPLEDAIQLRMRENGYKKEK